MAARVPGAARARVGMSALTACSDAATRSYQPPRRAIQPASVEPVERQRELAERRGRCAAPVVECRTAPSRGRRARPRRLGSAGTRRTRRDEVWRSTRPSTASTSAAVATHVAPSRRSVVACPRDAGLRTEPGTAITGTPRVAASVAVCSAPPCSCDSTTTTTSASAAMMRLRAGKCHPTGAAPSGYSVSTSTASRATRPTAAALRRG